MTTKTTPREDTSPVIEVSHLTKDYGFGRGVFDVSIHVDKGEVFGFLGPNGAGKSTTIRHLMGFSRPDSGSARLLGCESFAHYDKVLRNVGYIPGEIALPAGLTGWQFLRMMQDMQGIRDEQRLRQMRERFELADSVLRGETKRMSLGVKRKLAVVSAFMSDPALLILDEPTSGLDPVMQETFIQFIHEEKRRGKTILMSSHSFDELEKTCDRVALINDGRIVDVCSMQELRDRPVREFKIEFQTPEDYRRFLSRGYEIIRRQEQYSQATIRIRPQDTAALLRELKTYNVKFISELPYTLEMHFKQLLMQSRTSL